MNKEITEDILLKAGFKETDRVDDSYTTFELTDWDITIIHYRYHHCYYRQWCCKASNNNGFDCAEADIQTIDHFNKLMDLMDISFRLKEEKNMGGEITKRVLFDAGFKVGGTHENLFKLEHGFYKIMIGPVEDNANGKKFLCTVEEPRRRVLVASIAISTVADFNKLMDLMDIDSKLKEE